MDEPRSSGLLLHISSLPGAYGMGDFGPEAYRFADFLEAAKQEIWQVLPLVPTGLGNSPYSSPSTFATNPLFISIDALIEQGLLVHDEAVELARFPSGHVEFGRVLPAKQSLLRRAFERFDAGAGHVNREAHRLYQEANADWLEDYATFMALKERFDDRAWMHWPRPYAQRDSDAIRSFREQHATDIRRHVFWQYLAYEQWRSLKAYCNRRRIRIFGDLPIYVAHDSADVWAHPELFFLDDEGFPTVVAGVPPDYFSETGQRWGNPLYRWDDMRENDYHWWRRRLATILERVDIVRLDHFRGFQAYWEIPASEETAVNGEWIDGPGAHFFETMQRHLGLLPVVAEDLGIITPDVTRLMRQFEFPGMAVLQFGFDSGPDSTFLPHNFIPELVAYTGTHDNDTLAGWWMQYKSTQTASEANAARNYARRYLDLCSDDQFVPKAIRALLGSVARTTIVPVQDLLALGTESRMNTPGLGSGNWGWRLEPGLLTDDVAHRLAELTTVYGRTPETR